MKLFIKLFFIWTRIKYVIIVLAEICTVLFSIEIEKTRIEFEINIENIKSTETEVRKSKLILGNNK